MNLNETIIYVIRRIGWPGLSCGGRSGDGGARGHNAKFELNIATLAVPTAATHPKRHHTPSRHKLDTHFRVI